MRGFELGRGTAERKRVEWMLVKRVVEYSGWTEVVWLIGRKVKEAVDDSKIDSKRNEWEGQKEADLRGADWKGE